MKIIRPSSIRLEASTYCQLKCPACPNANRRIDQVLGRGHLAFSNFRHFIGKNRFLKHIELSNWGEIFLNPDLSKIIEFAYYNDIILTAENGVNLNTAEDNLLEGLVKYKFRSMACSIDGVSDKSYQQYRVGGKLNRVLENINKINFYKTKYNSRFPLLKWLFIVFGHNEHEIPLAREMAENFRMDFHLRLNWREKHSPIRNKKYVREEIGLNVSSRSEYRQRYGQNYRREVCLQLWSFPQINWDGKMLGCCNNFWQDFGGNVFQDGLLKCLAGEKIANAKKMLTGKKQAKEDNPCTRCPKFIDIKTSKKWLTMDEIRESHKEFERLSLR